MCSYEGATFYDKTSDVYLNIPRGAIPRDVSITVDIAATLYGPYKYPDGLIPATPVVWFCARGQEHFTFLKSVQVSLPHYLRLSSEAELVSVGLAVLKSGHESNTFTCAEVEVIMDSERKDHLKFSIMHTCYLCLAPNFPHQSMSKMWYCCV